MVGFQVMPPLTSDERAELESSIVENGVQVPILVAADGTIVDGHHRDEIARKHDLHCPRTVSDKSEQELRGLAFSLNLHRRHLTREQKRAIVAESIKADPQLSDREHGRRTGVDNKTAASVRSDLVAREEIPHVSERTDSAGRQQPASKPSHQVTVTDESGTEVSGMVDDRDPANATERESDVVPGFTAEDIADMQVQPERAKPKRRPLPESFDSASFELRKAVERVVRLSGDDRLGKNKDQIKASNLSDLVRVRDAIDGVINTLKG